MPTSIPRRRTVGEGARLVTLLLLVSPAMRALAIRFELARVATSDSVSEFFADRHARVQACFRRHACHRLPPAVHPATLTGMDTVILVIIPFALTFYLLTGILVVAMIAPDIKQSDGLFCVALWPVYAVACGILWVVLRRRR